jgi:hypothetical protein
MTEINKYQNGKIYKIVCNKTNLVYIGSTTQKYLSDRLKGHRIANKRNKGLTTANQILENGDFYIELVELFPCNSKDELLVRERYYFDIIECVNKQRPKRTLKEIEDTNKEYYEKNKDVILVKQKIYVENNKEHIKEQTKKYREEHKQQLKEQNQKYQNENKEKIKEQRKKYREENKEKIKEQKRQDYQKRKDTASNMGTSSSTISNNYVKIDNK